VLVLNNFNQSDEQHVKLMKVTFQHMYRTINVNTVKLGDCRRVVLYHYLPESGQVEMRHYAVRASPVGISRNVKKIIQSKIPDLGNLEDISEFVEGNAGGFGSVSDSEAEEEGSRVTLPERYVGRGNAKAQLSAMKLVELGPRMTMELFKVEQGVNEGDILYHKFVHKTPEEAAAIKARIERERALKEQRRRVQEENVKRKRDAKDEKKRLRDERKKRRLEDGSAEQRSSDDEDEDDDEEDEDEEEGEEASDGEDEAIDEDDYQDNDYDYDGPEDDEYEGEGDEDEDVDVDGEEEDDADEEEDDEDLDEEEELEEEEESDGDEDD
jgi:ribosome biogenesis protein SSF1/2